MKYPKGMITIPVLIIVVVVAGLLAGGSWWYVKQQDEKISQTDTVVVANANITANVNSTSVSNDVDAFGCTVSTGSTWCEKKQKCVLAWEEQCPSTETEEPTEVAKAFPVQLASSTYDYLGSVSLVNIHDENPGVNIASINTISFIGDRALIGGDNRTLYYYDGKTLSDISHLINQEEAFSQPRVHEIGSNGEYWLLSVYGSNYLKFYKYDGTTMQEITLPTLPKVSSSWTPEAITWTGKYFIMFLAGSLYKYDGVTFSEIHEFSADYLYDAGIAWNGQAALVVFPLGNGPSEVYSYANDKVMKIDSPNEHFTSVEYNGKYWLFGGAKFMKDKSLPVLYKYQDGKWTDLTKNIVDVHDSNGPVLDVAWSGVYWVITTNYGTYIMHGDAATYARELSRGKIEFGNSYGLIGSGGNLVKIITKDRIAIKTVQSSKLFECFSSVTLKKNPQLLSFLESKNFTSKDFTDLCVATSSNPQKRFFVITPTPTKYDTTTKANVTCDHCFTFNAYSLEDGALLNVDTNMQPNEIVLPERASTCEFGAREGDILLVQCAMLEDNPQYTYYNLLSSRFSTKYLEPYFSQQCSTWSTDSVTPLQKGEYEKRLTFYSQKVNARCGNAPIPPEKDWAKYTQDGFSFRYPKTYYFSKSTNGAVQSFVVHPRNLNGFEGGGPFDSSYIRLKPAISYAALLANVKSQYNFTKEYGDTMVESTVGTNRKIVVTPGPGMCDGEYVYVLGSTYLLEYGQYCMDWNGIDRTFTLN